MPCSIKYSSTSSPTTCSIPITMVASPTTALLLPSYSCMTSGSQQQNRPAKIVFCDTSNFLQGWNVAPKQRDLSQIQHQSQKTKHKSGKNTKTCQFWLCFPKIVANSKVFKLQKWHLPKNKSQLTRMWHQKCLCGCEQRSRDRDFLQVCYIVPKTSA